MRSIGPTITLLALASLTACAPTVWNRPGTSQAEFNMDRAQCQVMAEGANPDRDIDPINTGHFKRDLAANAAVGILSGIAQGAAVGHSFSLCMQAKGYMPGESEPVAKAAPAPSRPATQAEIAVVLTTPEANRMGLVASRNQPVQAASTVLVPSEPPPVRPEAAMSTKPILSQTTCTNDYWSDDRAAETVQVCNPFRASYAR
jgi:hypothetical protein